MAIIETKITEKKIPINNIDLIYSYKHCQTESSAGGALLYIEIIFRIKQGMI